MKTYHRTSDDAARAILSEGFRDSTGFYGTPNRYTGVWLSDQPLDSNEGTQEGPVLEVTLALTEEAMARYEWVQEQLHYREWLMPAALINQHSSVRLVDEETIRSILESMP